MFEPNPQADALRAMANDMASGLLYGRGGRFTGLDRLYKLQDAAAEAERLDASKDYLSLFEHVIRAVRVLDGGKRVFSLREAQQTLERDLPRMANSASWPGVRAQLAKAPRWDAP